MKIQDKVKMALKDLPLSGLEVEIEPANGLRVVAVVTSPDFEIMDEGKRQHLVWKKLIESLDDDEQTLVEFVHTMAPSEMEPAEDEV
jgi:sRNA-binding regulator protein Hfq